MENTESKIKNRAFKMWMVKAFSGDVHRTADYIWDLLMDRAPKAFELMEEAGAEFTQDGCDTAATFVIKQVKEYEHQQDT